MNAQIVKWIKIVVMRTLREKGLTRLDVSTLISAGMLGYSQALRRFDKDRGVKFKTFAEYRIKGAVLDEVRKMIGDERCKTKRPRKVDDFDFDLIGDDGRQFEYVESAMSIQSFMASAALDVREKEILECRYAGMNLREISQKFGFSESRASQLLVKIKKEVYAHYSKEMKLDFGLATHQCPSCHGDNTVSDRVDGFRCDICDADLRIVDGVPILAVTDDGLSGEDIDVQRFAKIGLNA
jgi:RNA polymerase sigma factor (sigma-70 family)